MQYEKKGACSQGEQAPSEKATKKVSALILELPQFNELESMGRALGDTGRLQSCIQPVHAVVTLNSLSCFRIVLWDMPGARTLTCHTANALFLVHIYNAIFPLLHGLCRTDGHTEWLFTVIA